MVVFLALIDFPLTSQLRNKGCDNFNCVYLRDIILEMRTSKKLRQNWRCSQETFSISMNYFWQKFYSNKM
jgi:hypothetical protein